MRLNEDSASLLLQSCLGGVAKDFNVVHLSGWMFQFSVSCKNVGLLVYKLKNFSCKFFFHLLFPLGAMVVPIGSKIMMFGAVSKKPSGLLLVEKENLPLRQGRNVMLMLLNLIVTSGLLSFRFSSVSPFRPIMCSTTLVLMADHRRRRILAGRRQRRKVPAVFGSPRKVLLFRLLPGRNPRQLLTR